MKTLAVVGTIAAVGVVAVAALATIPVWADASAGPGPGTGIGIGAPGTGMGNGHQGVGIRNGGQGMGLRDGSCLVTDPGGILSEVQRSALAANAEEEKLAHDLYAEFANRYSATVFDRIAAAETMHLNAVRTLMNRYGVTDPTAGKAVGQFTTPAVQNTYNELLARGGANERAAHEVGKTVETQDIAQLRTALSGLTAPDVQRVYTHLLSASEHHLAAFETWLAR
jgi:hypothetical protein